MIMNRISEWLSQPIEMGIGKATLLCCVLPFVGGLAAGAGIIALVGNDLFPFWF